jgi:hypothetical protein
VAEDLARAAVIGENSRACASLTWEGGVWLDSLTINFSRSSVLSGEQTFWQLAIHSPFSQSVSFVQVSQSVGKPKWFAICPRRSGGEACGRRVKALYREPGGREFACRHCLNLPYSSNRKQPRAPKYLMLKPRLPYAVFSSYR